jgi:2-polyprenyl-6-methoxyphenol hydroxylase-like FAD-dependent oxidoreductase
VQILIVGAEIAGLSAAWWLHHEGHDLTVLEQAPHLRDEGYMLDFFGPGYDVAERMVMLAELEAIQYPIARFVFHGRDGKAKFSLPYRALRHRLFSDRHFNFMRGDLERLLFARVRGAGVEVRFEAQVRSVSQHGSSVRVESTDGTRCTAELLIGADGVHSTVRELVFGPEERFARFLGHHTAASIAGDPDLAHEAGTHSIL